MTQETKKNTDGLKIAAAWRAALRSMLRLITVATDIDYGDGRPDSSSPPESPKNRLTVRDMHQAIFRKQLGLPGTPDLPEFEDDVSFQRFDSIVCGRFGGSLSQFKVQQIVRELAYRMNARVDTTIEDVYRMSLVEFNDVWGGLRPVEPEAKGEQAHEPAECDCTVGSIRRQVELAVPRDLLKSSKDFEGFEDIVTEHDTRFAGDSKFDLQAIEKASLELAKHLGEDLPYVYSLTLSEFVAAWRGDCEDLSDSPTPQEEEESEQSEEVREQHLPGTKETAGLVQGAEDNLLYKECWTVQDFCDVSANPGLLGILNTSTSLSLLMQRPDNHVAISQFIGNIDSIGGCTDVIGLQLVLETLSTVWDYEVEELLEMLLPEFNEIWRGNITSRMAHDEVVLGQWKAELILKTYCSSLGKSDVLASELSMKVLCDMLGTRTEPGPQHAIFSRDAYFEAMVARTSHSNAFKFCKDDLVTLMCDLAKNSHYLSHEIEVMTLETFNQAYADCVPSVRVRRLERAQEEKGIASLSIDSISELTSSANVDSFTSLYEDENYRQLLAGVSREFAARTGITAIGRFIGTRTQVELAVDLLSTHSPLHSSQLRQLSLEAFNQHWDEIVPALEPEDSVVVAEEGGELPFDELSFWNVCEFLGNKHRSVRSKQDLKNFEPYRELMARHRKTLELSDLRVLFRAAQELRDGSNYSTGDIEEMTLREFNAACEKNLKPYTGVFSKKAHDELMKDLPWPRKRGQVAGKRTGAARIHPRELSVKEAVAVVEEIPFELVRRMIEESCKFFERAHLLEGDRDMFNGNRVLLARYRLQSLSGGSLSEKYFDDMPLSEFNRLWDQVPRNKPATKNPVKPA